MSLREIGTQHVSMLWPIKKVEKKELIAYWVPMV
jgi:hypothetical protein